MLLGFLYTGTAFGLNDTHLKLAQQLFDQGNYKLCWKIGQSFEGRGHYKQALRYYQMGAEQGIRNCVIETAMLYSNEEHGIKQDLTTALNYLQQVEKHHPYDSLIHYNQGIAYFKTANNIQARYHFTLADALGDVDATDYLAQLKQLDSSHLHLQQAVDKTGFKPIIIADRLRHFDDRYTQLNNSLSEYHFNYGSIDIRIRPHSLQLTAALNIKNAREYGKALQLLQRSLYVDSPPAINRAVNEMLNKLLAAALSSNGVSQLEFRDRFIHRLHYDYEQQRMSYEISR